MCFLVFLTALYYCCRRGTWFYFFHFINVNIQKWKQVRILCTKTESRNRNLTNVHEPVCTLSSTSVLNSFSSSVFIFCKRWFRSRILATIFWWSLLAVSFSAKLICAGFEGSSVRDRLCCLRSAIPGSDRTSDMLEWRVRRFAEKK